MSRSSINMAIHRRLWLLLCLVMATGLSIILTFDAQARPLLPQETSPLSPLTPQEISPLVPMPSTDLAPLPSLPVTTTELAPLPALPQTVTSTDPERQIEPAALATPVTNPAGPQPRRAQLSLVLVGLILAGLIGVVVSVVVQTRRG